MTSNSRSRSSLAGNRSVSTSDNAELSSRATLGDLETGLVILAAYNPARLSPTDSRPQAENEKKMLRESELAMGKVYHI